MRATGNIGRLVLQSSEVLAMVNLRLNEDTKEEGRDNRTPHFNLCKAIMFYFFAVANDSIVGILSFTYGKSAQIHIYEGIFMRTNKYISLFSDLVLWKKPFFLFILIKKTVLFVFYLFFFSFFFYQSYDCVLSPYFVNRVYFSAHNNTHNEENSSDFQNQKFIDETDHIKVRVISQIGTNLNASSL